jgi:hypothetical protein
MDHGHIKQSRPKTQTQDWKKSQRPKIKIEFLGMLVVYKINKFDNWPIVDKKNLKLMGQGKLE